MEEESHGSNLPGISRLPPDLLSPEKVPTMLLSICAKEPDSCLTFPKHFSVVSRPTRSYNVDRSKAFRSSERAGLRYRPSLLQPEAVGYELGIQVMLHPNLMGERMTQGKWRPNLRYLPPTQYSPVFLDERLWLRHTRRLNVNTTLRSAE